MSSDVDSDDTNGCKAKHDSYIGQDRESDFILFRCCCSHASLWTVLRGVYAIVRGISSVANDKRTGTVKVWKCSFVSVHVND